MKPYIATVSTADGRITKGKTYIGNRVVIHCHNHVKHARIAVVDNLNEIMTFNPQALRAKQMEYSDVRK